MIKVYYELIEGQWIIPLLFSHHRENASLYNNLPFRKKSLEQIEGHFVERVQKPDEADYLVVPHHYGRIKNNKSYIKKLNRLSNDLNKKIIVYAFQDDAEPIVWPEAIIFKVSAYKSELLANEFVLPYIVEDFSLSNKFYSLRVPEEEIAVGFVGLAGFDSLYQAIRSGIKEFFRHVESLVVHQRPLGVKRKGVLLRKEMLSILSRDNSIKTNYIIRSRYSGHASDLSKAEVDKIRSEYIENILSSDVTLSPRGEGNGSQRFYEVLSLGRIPLLVDTDNSLPFEDKIPYDRFVVRVPYSERKKAGEYVKAFFDGMTDEEFAVRQKEAQDYFRKYLSLNAYYRYLFVDENIRSLG